jgi:ribosomal protein L20A (L18A)
MAFLSLSIQRLPNHGFHLQWKFVQPSYESFYLLFRDSFLNPHFTKKIENLIFETILYFRYSNMDGSQGLNDSSIPIDYVNEIKDGDRRDSLTLHCNRSIPMIQNFSHIEMENDVSKPLAMFITGVIGEQTYDQVVAKDSFKYC